MKAEAPPTGRRATRRIALRLLPFVFVMYVVCYIDRANVSFANLRMSADLGFSDRVYGLAVSIFFVGYMLFEVPGAIIVERWSARKWMARIMITWGLVTVLTGFVHTARQLYAARLLVGIAEASFFPGIIVYLTHWFRQSDRAKAIAFFYAAVPMSSVAGSFLAGWLLEMHWRGIAGWRWIFMLEGIPPIILGIVAFFYLTDWPREAGWLAEDERRWIMDELAAETQAKKKIRNYTVWQAFRDRQVILLVLAFFFALSGSLSTTYWIPTFIKRLSGLPAREVAFLVAIPGVVGIAGMLLNGWHSDKTGERRWHTVIPLACAGAAYLMLPWTGTHLAVAVLLLGYGVMFAYYPVFWSMPTMLLSESAAAACFGLIGSLGQIGGLVGPSTVGYLNTSTGSSAGAFVFIGACYLAASGIVSMIRIRNPVPAAPDPLGVPESKA